MSTDSDPHGPPWKCSCGCGCRKDHYDPYGSYCKRCVAGDCPSPDEDIPETCPQCKKVSDLATIDEFGWCLRDTCKRPRRYIPFSFTDYEENEY